MLSGHVSVYYITWQYLPGADCMSEHCTIFPLFMALGVQYSSHRTMHYKKKKKVTFDVFTYIGHKIRFLL